MSPVAAGGIHQGTRRRASTRLYRNYATVGEGTFAEMDRVFPATALIPATSRELQPGRLTSDAILFF